MCANTGHCVASRPFKSGDHHQMYGNVTMLGPQLYEVNVIDQTSQQRAFVRYRTKYFASFAFHTLEHLPAGNFRSCDQLPLDPSLTFNNIQVEPQLMGGWSGAKNNFDCGLDVQLTPQFGSSLTITL